MPTHTYEMMLISVRSGDFAHISRASAEALGPAAVEIRAFLRQRQGLRRGRSSTPPGEGSLLPACTLSQILSHAGPVWGSAVVMAH